MAGSSDDMEWASELEGASSKASGRRARRAGGGGSRTGRSGGRGGWGGRLLLVFLIGAAAGAAGAVFLPDLVGPFLPAGLGGPDELIRGPVLDKRREDERLLLTVETGEGAVLASFRERVAEIDLLVRPGDTVSLGVDRYRPFIEDPTVEGVRKARAVTPPASADTSPARLPAGPGTGASDTSPAEAPARDTAAGAAPAPDTAAARDTASGAAAAPEAASSAAAESKAAG